MNAVSLSSMLRYLLKNKTKVFVVFALTIIASLVFAYINTPRIKESESPVTVSEIKDNLNNQYKKMLDEEKSIEDKFPQLQFDELWRRYYKFFVSPKDAQRADKLVELYSDIILNSESISENFSKLAGMKPNEEQLSKLAYLSLDSDKGVIELRAYGPSVESTDYLANELLTLLNQRSEKIRSIIDHELIEVSTESKIISKESFLDSAKKTIEALEKKKTELLFKTSKINSQETTVSKKRHFIKFSVLGIVSGFLLNFLLLIFGSAGKSDYKNMREYINEGVPILGAYLIHEGSKPTLEQRLFSTAPIKSQKEIFEKAIFSMVPLLRQSDRPLLFLYDEEVPLDQWREMFQHYGVDVSYVSLNHNQELFNAIRQNAVALVAVKEDNFVDFVQESLPLLHPSSSICVAL